MVGEQTRHRAAVTDDDILRVCNVGKGLFRQVQRALRALLKGVARPILQLRNFDTLKARERMILVYKHMRCCLMQRGKLEVIIVKAAP